MDLQSLNSPLPKPWLELSCHRLLCDEIVVTPGPVTSQAFAAHSSATIPMPVLSNTLLNTVTVTNPGYDNAAGTYTAAFDQFIQLTFQINLQSSTLNAVASTQFAMFRNGVTIVPSLNRQTFVGNNASGFIISTALVRLTAGDVVGYRFDASNISGVWVINPASFTGVIV